MWSLVERRMGRQTILLRSDCICLELLAETSFFVGKAAGNSLGAASCAGLRLKV
jgi:hypothetical protein